MVEVRNVEDVFLSVLQEDTPRNKIDKETKNFDATDWQRLYELAFQHGLFPIFYTQLLSLNLENIPPEFLSKLKNLYLLNLKRNILLEQELIKIITCLKENNILVIPLKGPVLARYLYNDLAKRAASSDLDLLVPYEKIAEAEARLKSDGFIHYNKNYTYRPSIILRCARALHLNGKSEILGDYLLDLHWDLRGFFYDTHLELFWKNAKLINCNGNKILFPCDEDLILYLSQCASFNLEFINLKYIYDIYTMVLGRRIDWQSLIERARGIDGCFSLFICLKLARDLFHSGIPECLFSKIRPHFIKRNFLPLLFNKQNIFYRRKIIAYSYVWRYLTSSYLYSKDIFDCIRITYRKIFLPMNEVMQMYNLPVGEVSYLVYIKRLLKPINRFYR